MRRFGLFALALAFVMFGVLGCGDSAIRFCPPLCITAQQVETALQILGGILAQVHADGVTV